MNDKEEMLKHIKESTNWSDTECLTFYEQAEEMEGEIETCQVWYAYYIWNYIKGKRTYGVVTEEDYKKKNIKEAWEYYRCHSKKMAKQKIEKWKRHFRGE